jgi:Mg-chelatase subunit ChlD
MDVVAARAAAWMRRPARYRLTASARNAPVPRPGSISVRRGSASPATASSTAASSATGASARGKAAGAVELILDASGSMLQRFEGKKRIDVARDVLIQLVRRTLPKDTPIALRVFGDDAPGSCATRLAAPLAPVDPRPLSGLIAAVRPKNGAKTPIASSLAEVASDLESASGARTVVLVTDGEETCGGDPQAEIEALMAKGFDVRVNIVGFAVDDAKLKDTFREWAAAGGGQYFDAQSSKELGRALEAAVSEPFRALDAAGAVIATGIVSGPDVSVPAGVYRIEVGTTSPKVFADVVVDADQVTRLDVTP